MSETITQRIGIGIAEAAELMPLSKSSLYRLAESGEAPFRKVGGKWMTTPEELREWIQSAPKPRREHRSESPMPRPRRAKESSFGAKVIQFERAN